MPIRAAKKGLYDPALLEVLIQEVCLSCQEIIKLLGGNIKNFGVPAVAAA